jgi:hypothetical protein
LDLTSVFKQNAQHHSLLVPLPSTCVQNEGHPSEGNRQTGDGRNGSRWRHGDASKASAPARGGERSIHGHTASQEQYSAKPAQEGSRRVQRREASGQSRHRFIHRYSCDKGIVRDGCSRGEVTWWTTENGCICLSV